MNIIRMLSPKIKHDGTYGRAMIIAIEVRGLRMNATLHNTVYMPIGRWENCFAVNQR